MNFNFIYLFTTLFFISGCVSPNLQEVSSKEDLTKIKKQPKIDQISQKQILKVNCQKHTKIMNYANSYILNEFDKGYFFDKNAIGAKAQLFLIENKSQSEFAQNINKAQNSYVTQYNLAKKKGCDLKKYTITPLTKIKNTIKMLETKKN